ncbi:hypothetical protein TNCV_3088661 [Trichonephila clavipes]|uniref:Uncharacterized protein n=1 Tax=Trichonephila clavipes TaxID=2585209 RepID=A0A8X6V4E2_TRICX|nr:hypothetical protein TNCV_3088661 [Trichonephila clavipes]
MVVEHLTIPVEEIRLAGYKHSNTTNSKKYDSSWTDLNMTSRSTHSTDSKLLGMPRKFLTQIEIENLMKNLDEENFDDSDSEFEDEFENSILENNEIELDVSAN